MTERQTPNWSEAEIATLLKMRRNRASFAEISAKLPGRTVGACQQRYYIVTGRYRQGRAPAAAACPPASVSPPAPRGITAMVMGDPPPGRSALDRRKAAILR